MKITRHFTLASALCALTLSGCASADGRYPSLDIRPAERALGTLHPTKPEILPTPPATDLASIQSALDRALSANTSFIAQETDALDLANAASGDGPESDRRARALIAMAGLTSLRGKTALALADLDLLEVQAATGFSETNAIRSAQSSIKQMITTQDATLDSVAEALKP
ncbi:hypothetical protein [uncultured Erythrobacter sp.]|uniref:hypothetical protein n=1 Tax=uncultured Erythrobacter sp. TaxID=263913 RepID=UPI0026216456|nr:hypothetical protein [uncultured Erythrobacter sp.]